MAKKALCGLSTVPATTYDLSYSQISGFIRQKPEAGTQLVNRITWVASDISFLPLQAWLPHFKWQHLFWEELTEILATSLIYAPDTVKLYLR